VNVADVLPVGLQAVAISGAGWSCGVATLICTRNDALAAAASYPPVTVTVNVRSNAPASVSNVATVSGGGDADPDNNTFTDQTNVTATPLAAPTGLVATAELDTQIKITWDAVTAANNGYLLVRTTNGVGTEILSPTTTYTDTAVAPGTAYVYQAAAITPAMTAGPASNKDLATTVFFTDDPLVAAIKAVHFTDLQNAVEIVRTAAGFPPGSASFTVIAPNSSITANALTELRGYLDAARGTLGLSAVSYSDSPVTQNITTIKAAHILELRSGIN